MWAAHAANLFWLAAEATHSLGGVMTRIQKLLARHDLPYFLKMPQLLFFYTIHGKQPIITCVKLMHSA